MNALVLIALSVAAGILMLLAFRRFSDQRALRLAKARVRAHLYELWLFGDDPLLMLRAQKNLVAWNARYIRSMLRPAVVIAIPMLILFWQLDRMYGTRPFRPGETAVAAADVNGPALKAPPGFVVDTPAVRVPSRGRAYWRVRAIAAARFEASGVEINQPSASVRMAGLDAHWLVWFIVISGATMLALRRRLRVAL